MNPAGASAETGQPIEFVSSWPAGLDARLARMQEIVAGFGRTLVAYSGGVDSAVVLKICRDVLGKDQVLGVLAQSESYASREMESAMNAARVMDAAVGTSGSPQSSLIKCSRCTDCVSPAIARSSAPRLRA